MLAKQLKAAIKASDDTLYRIAKDSGCDYAVLSRFVSEGRDIKLSTVEKLADYFGMKLTAAKKGE